MTSGSYDDWKAALAVIGSHPQREVLIAATGQIVMTRMSSAEYAAAMVMHIIGGERGEDAPGPPPLYDQP